MRRIVFCIGLCCCGAVAVAQSTDMFPAATLTGTHWHIDATGLGPIRIGMPIDEALQVAGVFSVKAASKMAEGTKSKVYEVSHEGTLLFTIEPDKKTVWRIDVRSSEFRLGNIDGVGVGTTLEQLKQRFPTMRFHAAAGGELCGTMRERSVGHAFCFKNPHPAPTDTVDHVRIY